MCVTQTSVGVHVGCFESLCCKEMHCGGDMLCSKAPKELPPEQPPEQPPLSERGPGFDAADHPLSGVPNVEAGTILGL